MKKSWKNLENTRTDPERLRKYKCEHSTRKVPSDILQNILIHKKIIIIIKLALIPACTKSLHLSGVMCVRLSFGFVSARSHRWTGAMIERTFAERWRGPGTKGVSNPLRAHAGCMHSSVPQRTLEIQTNSACKWKLSGCEQSTYSTSLL